MRSTVISFAFVSFDKHLRLLFLQSQDDFSWLNLQEAPRNLSFSLPFNQNQINPMYFHEKRQKAAQA